MALIIDINRERLLYNETNETLYFSIVFSRNISVLDNYSIYVVANDYNINSGNIFDVNFEQESSFELYASVSTPSDRIFKFDGNKCELKIYLVDENKNIKETKYYTILKNESITVEEEIYDQSIQQLVNSISYSDSEYFYYEEKENDAVKFSVSNGIKTYDFDLDIKRVLDNILTPGIDFIRSQIDNENIRQIYESIYTNNVISYDNASDVNLIEYPSYSDEFIKNMLHLKETVPGELVFALSNLTISHSKKFDLSEYLAESLKREHERIKSEYFESIRFHNNETRLAIYEKNSKLRVKLIVDNSSNAFVNTDNVELFVEGFDSYSIVLNGNYTSVEDEYAFDVDLKNNRLSVFNQEQELYFYDEDQFNIFSPEYFSVIREVLNNPIKRSNLKSRIQFINEEGETYYTEDYPEIDVNYNVNDSLSVRNNITPYVTLTDNSTISIDRISLVSSGISRAAGYTQDNVIMSDDIIFQENLEMLENSFAKIEIDIDGFVKKKIIRLRDCEIVNGEDYINFLFENTSGTVKSIEVLCLNKYDNDFNSICEAISGSIPSITFSDTEYLANNIIRSGTLIDHDYFLLAFDIINS
jgi:hypothetical protein